MALRLCAFLCIVLFPFQLFAQDKTDSIDFDVEPVPLTDIRSKVVYPTLAMDAALEGTVMVSALLDIDGSILKIEVDSSTCSIFDEPAIEAMRKTRFSPAMLRGKGVKIWYSQRVVFKLGKAWTQRVVGRDSLITKPPQLRPDQDAEVAQMLAAHHPKKTYRVFVNKIGEVDEVIPLFRTSSLDEWDELVDRLEDLKFYPGEYAGFVSKMWVDVEIPTPELK
jgi:TonB family protein